MKRPVLVCALLLSTAAALSAQQSNPGGQYQGVSNPPPDDTITIPAPEPDTPPAKPSPAHYAPAPPPAPAAAPAPSAGGPIAVPDIVTGPEAGNTNSPDGALTPAPVDGTDGGIVRVAPAAPSGPSLSRREASGDGDMVHVQPEAQSEPGLNTRSVADPDADIVHPAPLPAGVVAEGTVIRARLLQGLSTSYSQDGQSFRARVASDVLDSAGHVVIPTGAEIDGTVSEVSTGHFAGHGSMLLRPETLILPDGTHQRLYAELWGAPGSNTRVGGEGKVSAGSRTRKDEVEYGGGVGAGLVTGAVLGGPAGALAGTLVGAGAVTVHLMMDHPQATLDEGDVLLFSLTEPLHVAASAPEGQVAAQPAAAQPESQVDMGKTE